MSLKLPYFQTVDDIDGNSHFFNFLWKIKAPRRAEGMRFRKLEEDLEYAASFFFFFNLQIISWGHNSYFENNNNIKILLNLWWWWHFPNLTIQDPKEGKLRFFGNLWPLSLESFNDFQSLPNPWGWFLHSTQPSTQPYVCPETPCSSLARINYYDFICLCAFA